MTLTSERAAIGTREAWATRVGFFVAGFAMAAWAPLIGFAKARAALDDGRLGLVLLGLGCGSIVAMPIAGALASRIGCRRVIVAAAVLACLALPGLAVASNAFVLAALLLCFGAGVGSVDCVINVQAVVVEKAFGRPMMSGFHGLFSVGGVAGAGGMSLLLALGLSPLTATLVVVAITAVVLAVAAPGLLPFGGTGDGPAFAVPHGIVLLIGGLCFIVFLTEGAMLDWSGVFLIGERGVDPATAGAGYAVFATAMTIGRLSGDLIVKRLGGSLVVTAGAVLAAAGLCMVVLVPGNPASLFGFLMVGAGCSNIVPVLYSAVGRQETMPESVAVPAISTLCYAGILAGPALIGALAHGVGLGTALLVVAALLVVVASSGRRLP